MIELQVDEDRDLVTAQVIGELTAADWDAVTPVIDAAIARFGRIKLLLDVREFDGWQNLAAAKAHLAFIRSHHRQVDRVAVVSSRQWLYWLVSLAQYFVSTTVKAFEPRHVEAAVEWLETGYLTQPSVSIESAEKDHVLLVRINGRLGPGEYKNSLVPVVESAMEAQQRINFIVDLTEFNDQEVETFEREMASRLAHASKIGRIALVGDQFWLQRCDQLSASLPAIEVRAFLPSDWQRARIWVAD